MFTPVLPQYIHFGKVLCPLSCPVTPAQKISNPKRHRTTQKTKVLYRTVPKNSTEPKPRRSIRGIPIFRVSQPEE